MDEVKLAFMRGFLDELEKQASPAVGRAMTSVLARRKLMTRASQPAQVQQPAPAAPAQPAQPQTLLGGLGHALKQGLFSGVKTRVARWVGGAPQQQPSGGLQGGAVYPTQPQ